MLIGRLGRLRPQLPRLLLIITRGSLIFELFRDCGGMAEQRGVANTYLQRLIQLGASFSVLRVRVERPGVSVESLDVLPPGNLRSRHAHGFSRLVRIVGVVKDQLAIGVVRFTANLAGLAIELRKCAVRFGRRAGRFR